MALALLSFRTPSPSPSETAVMLRGSRSPEGDEDDDGGDCIVVTVSSSSSSVAKGLLLVSTAWDG